MDISSDDYDGDNEPSLPTAAAAAATALVAAPKGMRTPTALVATITIESKDVTNRRTIAAMEESDEDNEEDCFKSWGQYYTPAASAEEATLAALPRGMPTYPVLSQSEFQAAAAAAAASPMEESDEDSTDDYREITFSTKKGPYIDDDGNTGLVDAGTFQPVFTKRPKKGARKALAARAPTSNSTNSTTRSKSKSVVTATAALAEPSTSHLKATPQPSTAPVPATTNAIFTVNPSTIEPSSDTTDAPRRVHFKAGSKPAAHSDAMDLDAPLEDRAAEPSTSSMSSTATGPALMHRWRGLHFETANAKGDIIDMVIAVLQLQDPKSRVRNHANTKPKKKGTEINVGDLIKLLGANDKSICCDFLGTTDRQNRGDNGIKWCRAAALYLKTPRSVKDIKNEFGSKMKSKGIFTSAKWYLKRYIDFDPDQKVFASLLGKNPERGHGPDYEERVHEHLRPYVKDLNLGPFKISAVRHYEPTSQGRVKVWGFQVSRKVAKALERLLRAHPLPGLPLLMKSAKQNKPEYEKKIARILHTADAFTGIPVYRLPQAVVQPLRAFLLTLPGPCGHDLEGTHLSPTIGKYMIVTVSTCVAAVTAAVTEYLATAVPPTAEQPLAPTLVNPDPRPSRRQPQSSSADDLSVISPDPFEDIASWADASNAVSTASGRSRKSR